MYAPWECKAVATERAALELARDARAGHLGDPDSLARFDAALSVFVAAKNAHVAATGCTDMH
jgi:hypothetical protein